MKSSLTYVGAVILITAVLGLVLYTTEDAAAQPAAPVVTAEAPAEAEVSEETEAEVEEPGWLDNIRTKLLGDAVLELDEREAELDALEAELEQRVLEFNAEIDKERSAAVRERDMSKKVLADAEATRMNAEQYLLDIQTCIANAGG
jgi:molecular chaperone GrpE (heat shock protein)